MASEALLADFQSEAFDRGALGFYLDERSGEMVVVVPETRTASFRLPLPPPGTAVRQRDIMVDPDELDRALARLGERAPELTATGDRSLAYYFDARLGKIAVLGTIDTATMVEVVGDAFDVVEYRAGVGIVPTSRSWMQPPFSGGAQAKRVGSVNTFDCTTGFTVKKTSTGLRYMVTAGHCGALGSSWISPGSGHTIGAIRFRQLGPSDTALIGDKTYQPVIYTGDAVGVASTVKGAANPVLNKAIYCYSGAVTLDQCTVTVTSMSVSHCYSGGCFTNQMSFQQFGRCPSRVGDSGAPFYLDFDFGGFPYIRGMVTAGTTDNSVCFGEYWSRISGALGVTIVSG